MRLCEASQVPCGPVYAIDEIFEDPHYAARENILRVNDPRMGTLAIPNLVPKMSATPGKVNWLGPERDVAMLGMMACCAARWERLRDMPVEWGWPRAVFSMIPEIVPRTPRPPN